MEEYEPVVSQYSVEPSPRFNYVKPQEQAVIEEDKNSSGRNKNEMNDFSFSQETSIASNDQTPHQEQIYTSPLKNSSFVKSMKSSFASGLEEKFDEAKYLVELKWHDTQNWPESSPLRIELFSLLMQALYGSFYKNKIRAQDMINKFIIIESNRLHFTEAWKHKFRKNQKEAMTDFVQYVEKIEEFLLLIGTPQKDKSPQRLDTKESNHSSHSQSQSALKQSQSLRKKSDEVPSKVITIQKTNSKVPLKTRAQNFSMTQKTTFQIPQLQLSGIKENQENQLEQEEILKHTPTVVDIINAQEIPEAPKKLNTESLSKYSIDYVFSNIQSPQKTHHHPRTPAAQNNLQFGSILEDHIFTNSSKKPGKIRVTSSKNNSMQKSSLQSSPEVNSKQQPLDRQSNSKSVDVNIEKNGQFNLDLSFNDSVKTFCIQDDKLLKILTTRREKNSKPQNKVKVNKKDFCFANFVNIEDIQVKNSVLEMINNNQNEHKKVKIPLEEGIVPECLNQFIGNLNKSKEINQLVFGYEHGNDIVQSQETVTKLEEVRLRSSLFLTFQTSFGLTDNHIITSAKQQLQVSSFENLRRKLQYPINYLTQSSGNVKIMKDFNYLNYYIINRDLSQLKGLNRSITLDYFTYSTENQIIILMRTYPLSKSKISSLFFNIFDIPLHVIRIEGIGKIDDKEEIVISSFYCVDYNSYIFHKREDFLNFAKQEQNNLILALRQQQ